MNFDWSRVVFVLSVLMVSSVLGVGSALYAVRTVAEVESFHNGPWRTHATYGEESPTPWLRTAQAMTGLFALPRAQALYFTADTDSRGQPLVEECLYHLTGRPPAGEWWSLALYGRDQFLVADPGRGGAVDAGTVQLRGDGRIEITVGGPPGAANRLAVEGAGGFFSLTLRIHGPDETVWRRLDEAPLFAIDRGACR
ncbi:DUF1214 domain-containing protein [Minwuia thermotolerans]|nr:DUF1214 domain-containing protein [Minwuia thermotolerans]